MVNEGILPTTKAGTRNYIDVVWLREKLQRDGTLERTTAVLRQNHDA
jgi:hypothetical protein